MLTQTTGTWGRPNRGLRHRRYKSGSQEARTDDAKAYLGSQTHWRTSSSHEMLQNAEWQKRCAISRDIVFETRWWLARTMLFKVGGFGVEERGHSMGYPVPRGGSVAVPVAMKSSSVDRNGVELGHCST